MKTLMLEYPLSYLEFEVIFVKVIRKKWFIFREKLSKDAVN
jgi:hypothetical protein